MVGFSYEAFFEYVIARQILDEKWSTIDIRDYVVEFKGLIKKAESNRQVRGALEYIVLFMEDLDRESCIDMLVALDETNTELEIVGCNAISKMLYVDEELSETLKCFTMSDSITTIMAAREVFVAFQFRTNNMTDILWNWTEDGCDTVRETAGASLSRIESVDYETKFEITRTLLTDQLTNVRLSTIYSLAEIIDENLEGALKYFHEWTKSGNKKLMEGVVRAISHMTRRPDPRLFNILSKIRERIKPDSHVNSLIAIAISKTDDGTPEAYELLMKIAEESRERAIEDILSTVSTFTIHDPGRTTDILLKTLDVYEEDRGDRMWRIFGFQSNWLYRSQLALKAMAIRIDEMKKAPELRKEVKEYESNYLRLEGEVLRIEDVLKKRYTHE
jgi:hypothetical protein